jgi:hypothetical protein
MSHFTTLKTKMIERDPLEQALTDLGYRYETGSVKIRGYEGIQTDVEIKVPTASRGYDIGFRRNGDGYELVADWWGISGIDQGELVRGLTRRYAYHVTRAKLAEQGFELADEQVESDGRIHLLLRRVS